MNTLQLLLDVFGGASLAASLALGCLIAAVEARRAVRRLRGRKRAQPAPPARGDCQQAGDFAEWAREMSER